VAINGVVDERIMCQFFGRVNSNCYQSAMAFVTGQSTLGQLLDNPQQNGERHRPPSRWSLESRDCRRAKKSELGGQNHKQETSNGVVETIGLNHSKTPTDIRGPK